MKKSILLVAIFGSLFWGSVVSADANTSPTTSCARGDLLISEVDYDQPGTDDGEFVELFGRPNASLADYELHLVSDDGTPYAVIDLSDESITASGFFVVGNRDLFTTPQLFLNNDGVSNEKAAVAIYDVTSASYCNAINYEGTVSGFSDWFNIGFDSPDHGEGRGCARSASGWWSCNRPTTPGGSNGVVAVTLEIAQTEHNASLLLSVFAGLLATTIALGIREERNTWH